MADMVMLRKIQVLGVHSNESKEGKVYMTIYAFKPGPEEGFDRPQLLELSTKADDLFKLCKANIGKSLDLVADKMTYRNGDSRYELIGQLSEFLKAG